MAPPHTPPMLEAIDLACRRGGRRVFEGLSLFLEAGVLLALTGPNGSGKTTLLRALALLVPLEAGVVRYKGNDVTADRESWRGQIAWLGHLDGLKGDLTVRENLSVAERLRGGDGSRVEAAVATFDLSNLAGRAVRTLSAGQRRRTALARVAANGAALWLLDEPFNALDVPAQTSLRAALTTHLASGGLAIAATHTALDIAGTRTLEFGK